MTENTSRCFVIEQVLLHAVRNERVFQEARVHLRPEHFYRADEAVYRALWIELLAYYDRHSELPPYTVLHAAVCHNVEHTPGLPGEGLVVANELVGWIFEQPESELRPAEALSQLRDLLIEREAEQRLRNMLAGGRAYNLPDIIQQTQHRLETLSAIGQVLDDSTMPTSWTELQGPQWPTGVGFVDAFMEGGETPKNVNILLGPTGGGKTTLMVQLCVSIGRRQVDIAARQGGTPGLSVFFGYEEPKLLTQTRIAANAATVKQARLRFESNNLSRRGQLADYERELFHGQDLRTHPGELERLETARVWVDKYIRIRDFHASVDGGRGGLPEVRQHLLGMRDKAGIPIRAVFLDWAGELVRRKLLTTSAVVDSARMAMELSGLVAEAKTIASDFNCTVWIAHQLKGTVTSNKPGWLPHHSHAKNCTSFADNACFAICLGSKDLVSSCVRCVASKTRHAASSLPIICRIEGDLCRLVDVTENYLVDPLSHSIVPREGTAGRREHVDPAIFAARNASIM